ncbi:SGNH/GDSL hydrolase family protein [Blastococcus sp. TF02A-26]|uniref:SGNH/GDSL hydrolase family protein n=1 Tax=Blastococcus sp. TF02A-26 TaxID=2250577 RepID=UPI0011BEA56F|nr:SGNH/GDSL hydrolase family protein [Blastococcus sp. TF02A-26]
MTQRRWMVVAAAVAVLVVGIGAVFLLDRPSEAEKQCDDVTQARDDLLAAADDESAVAVIGDSYSQGTGLAGPDAAWPARLAGLIGAPVAVDGMGSTGFTTAGFCEGDDVTYGDRLADDLPETDVVVVQGGANDATLGDPAGVQQAATDLLADLEDVPTVVVVGPPAVPAADRAAVDTVDRGLRAATEGAGRIYVPLIDADIPLLADGIHPTEAGQARIAELIADALGR